jgi:quercetin dioxygenase-like cupin family protein
MRAVSEEEFEYQSLDELADAMEAAQQGPPAVELWQDYDPSMRFVTVFPVTDKQGAAQSTVAYYIFEPGKHSGLHFDDAEEVIYVADGEGEVFVSGKQVKLEPGDFVVVNEGVQHDVYAYGDRELRLLSFFPKSVVQTTFQDPVYPMGTNEFSSNFDQPVIREISAEELPPELKHLIGGGEDTPPEG